MTVTAPNGWFLLWHKINIQLITVSPKVRVLYTGNTQTWFYLFSLNTDKIDFNLQLMVFMFSGFSLEIYFFWFDQHWLLKRLIFITIVTFNQYSWLYIMASVWSGLFFFIYTGEFKKKFQYTIASLKVACFWKVGTWIGPSMVWFKTVSFCPLRDNEGDAYLVWLKNDWAWEVACEDQLPSRERIVPLERDEWTDLASASATELRRPDSQAMRCLFEVVLFAILPETLPARVMTILREECDGFRPRPPHDCK